MGDKIKNFLKYIPGGYDLDCFFRNPKEEINNWVEYLRLKRKFARGEPCAKKPRGRLLVISLMGNFVSGVKQEILLTKAAEFAGFEPVILTKRWAWANRFYRAFGVDSFVYFEDFLDAAKQQIDRGAILKDAKTIMTFDELMDYSYIGVNIGKYICSSLVRKTYTGAVEMDNPEVRAMIKNYLIDTSVNAVAASCIYDKYKPDAVLFLERGYTPYGEFFDIALKRNLNVVQWCGSHKNNALILKRYNLKNKNQHPASLSAKTWEFLKKMPWDKNRANIVTHELFKNYASGEWFGEVGTQFKVRMMKPEEIKRELGLDSGKKTAVILSHLFWDATFFYGEDIFTNYREWFIEAVKAACKNKHVNWILKFHPANVVKLNRDGYKGELIEKISIKEEIGELPSHIKILEPNTKISTYSLYKVMDYCLTVRGTPGIEAAMFGVPVLTAGTGRYDRHGFTIDSSNREDYLDKLSKIHTYPRLTPQQIELAQKFAYGTFVLRPFELKSIDMRYKRDKKATPVIGYTVNLIKELRDASDAKAFGYWLVNSQDEDYLDSDELRKLGG